MICLGWRRMLIAAAYGAAMFPGAAEAQGLVPGTGRRLENVGDDFEDPQWKYHHNSPKSSEENDNQQRLPAGRANNGRWAEGLKRGQPDVIERVETPPDGLPGSKGSIVLISKQTGVPGAFSGDTRQDDLIAVVDKRVGGAISVARAPSVVVRVYLPPWEKWERRAGNSFALRAACLPTGGPRKSRGIFGMSAPNKPETYWPGMIFRFNPGDGDQRSDSATLVVRANGRGGDFDGLQIAEPGWWTLGMSFTPDGQVHYYAHAGVEPLTASDRIASQYPYGSNCERVTTFFFDVLSADDGHWSTPWIVDDAQMFVAR